MYEIPRVVKFIKTESRIEVNRGWERRNRELLFNAEVFNQCAAIIFFKQFYLFRQRGGKGEREGEEH